MIIARIQDNIADMFAMVRGLPDWRSRIDISDANIRFSFVAVLLGVLISIGSGYTLGALYETLGLPNEGVPDISQKAHIGLILFGTPLKWLASLSLLLALAERLPHRPSPYALIVGYNWVSLVGIGFTALCLLAALAVGSSGFFAIVGLWSFAFVVWMTFGVLKRGLGLEGLPTIGVMMGIMLIDVLLHQALIQSATTLDGVFGSDPGVFSTESPADLPVK